jgi:predicted DNA-binding transcriptional regulator AlpA
MYFVGKKIDLDYLVGAAEIAQRLNVKRPHLIHDWRRRYPEFPKPIVELTGILLWDWREVERWAQDSGRI